MATTWLFGSKTKVKSVYLSMHGQTGPKIPREVCHANSSSYVVVAAKAAFPLSTTVRFRCVEIWRSDLAVVVDQSPRVIAVSKPPTTPLHHMAELNAAPGGTADLLRFDTFTVNNALTKPDDLQLGVCCWHAGLGGWIVGGKRCEVNSGLRGSTLKRPLAVLKKS